MSGSGLALALILTLALAGSAHAQGYTGAPLTPATPHVVELKPRALPQARAARIAGSAHYDGGEWIYEDYPWTAYGAATPNTIAFLQAHEQVAGGVPNLARVNGAYFAFVQPQTGAGPFVEQADVSQLRLALDGDGLVVRARTTTMAEPVATALLLLFDTGRAGEARAVPFGSGLTTAKADTAVLATAAGARLVDLVTGAETALPASADPRGYVNTLRVRLPLSAVAAGDTVRFVAAAGVVEPGAFELVANGSAGPLAKVVPRFAEPVQGVPERTQAVALAGHDVDGFLTEVSLARLRSHDRERLRPGIGHTVRTFTQPRRYSMEEGTDGRLQQYGLYLPKGFAGAPAPATLFLRGSGYTATTHAAITPGLYRQLGDENGAIVISPGGRSGLSLWAGAAYADVDNALADAARTVPIDRDRLTAAGYSMGGYGALLFPMTQPDRFAAAFSIAGPFSPDAQLPVAAKVPDLVRGLGNLREVPVALYQGDADVNVAVTNALAVSERLRDLGYRYRLNIFPGHTHYSAGLSDEYSIGARYLRGARRRTAPAEVHFERNMALEHDIDAGTHSDMPKAAVDIGLRFDRAWFVRGLTATDAKEGTATIDVRTFARRRDAVTPVRSSGVDPGENGEVPSQYTAQEWTVARGSERRRNAFAATLTGAAKVTLVVRRMGLTVRRPLRGRVTTEQPLALTLRLPRRTCAKPRRVVLRLPAGTHKVRVRRPCA